jgi:hypothetical protein
MKQTKKEKCRALCNNTAKKHVKTIVQMVHSINPENAKKIDTNKMEETNYNKCVSENCNVGCKDTIFEKGKGSVLPKGVLKTEYPKSKKLTKNKKEDRKLFMKIMRKQRKRIFGENTNVLDKDSFYKNINYLGVILGERKGRLTKKKLMKIGAISGCYEMNDPQYFK